MWSDRRTPRRVILATAAVVGVAVLGGACSSGDDADEAPAEDHELLEVGQPTEVDGTTATVVALEPEVQATAEVYAADGDRVAVEVEVCGDADAVARLWTLAIGDDELEPTPLPESALPEENRPVFDFTAGPGPGGCRSGWVAWDVPVDDAGEGIVVWEGDPDVGWPTS
jgi:hypothetical protein